MDNNNNKNIQETIQLLVQGLLPRWGSCQVGVSVFLFSPCVHSCAPVSSHSQKLYNQLYKLILNCPIDNYILYGGLWQDRHSV